MPDNAVLFARITMHHHPSQRIVAALVQTNVIITCRVSSNNVHKEAQNLGIFDSQRSYNSQVSEVVQSCFAQLRQLTNIRSFLCSTALEKAFISSRFDNCNALYSCISMCSIQDCSWYKRLRSGF